MVTVLVQTVIKAVQQTAWFCLFSGRSQLTCWCWTLVRRTGSPSSTSPNQRRETPTTMSALMSPFLVSWSHNRYLFSFEQMYQEESLVCLCSCHCLVAVMSEIYLVNFIKCITLVLYHIYLLPVFLFFSFLTHVINLFSVFVCVGYTGLCTVFKLKYEVWNGYQGSSFRNRGQHTDLTTEHSVRWFIQLLRNFLNSKQLCFRWNTQTKQQTMTVMTQDK